MIMSMDGAMQIGTYRALPAALLEHDARAFAVAIAAESVIRARCPELIVEHIGSTSVAGCPGKGIVDLLCLYPDGHLERSKAILDSLGFQRQISRDPFPETRPMRVGALEYDNTEFRLHVHVVDIHSSEVAYVRSFRDRLRDDLDFRRRYIETKRDILQRGITDTLEYSQAKGQFIRGALLEMGFAPEDLPPAAKI